MSFEVQVFSGPQYAREAAAHIALSLPGSGSVVVTGGTTIRPIYARLADADAGWGSVEVFFSDERCVPPEDDASNYGMATRLLLDRARPATVHRMRGEDDPEQAARSYATEVEGAAGQGFDLVLLGLGPDCHIAGLFPSSPALAERRLCVSIDRPDGMRGVTLTPAAFAGTRRFVLPVAGRAKAEAVRRGVTGEEPPEACPVRVLAAEPDVTFLLDEDAASLL